MLTMVKGATTRPYKIVVYGQEGVGKTTFASAAPGAVFLCAERGADRLGCDRYELECVEDLLEALAHPPSGAETLILDTLDALEPMIWASVCRTERVANIEALQHGSGHHKAYEIWQRIRVALDRPSVKHHTMLLAHGRAVKTINPTGADFMRYALKLTKNNVSKNDPSDLWKEWADIVGFAYHDTVLPASKRGEAVKAVSAGGDEMPSKRMLGLSYSPSYDAKCRLPLPASMRLDGKAFWKAISEVPKTLPDTLEAIRAFVAVDNMAAFEAFAATATLADATKMLTIKVHGA